MSPHRDISKPPVVTASWRSRLWRYGPLAAWMLIIFLASTAALSASTSGRFLKPLLLWLAPNITELQVAIIHFVLRKGAHFTEYAILALLAARAFHGSAHEGLRKRWFAAAFLLTAFYAFSDEFHQSFIPARTGSIYDSLIDIAGGLTALVMMVFWQRRRDRIRGTSTA